MEYERLVRGLHFLEENNGQIGTVITDHHKQINSYLSEVYPDIEHRYDVCT